MYTSVPLIYSSNTQKKRTPEIVCNPRGSQCVKKLRIYVRTTTILYGGITFNFFFTCYHYVIFYFGLIEKGLHYL